MKLVFDEKRILMKLFFWMKVDLINLYFTQDSTPQDRPPQDRLSPGPLSQGPPTISRFFFSLPPQRSLFLPALGRLLVEFWWCF